LLVFWFSKLIQTCDHRNYSSPVSRPQGLGVLASSKHKGTSNTVLGFNRILSPFGHILHSQTSLCEKLRQTFVSGPLPVTSYRLVCLRTNLDHNSYFTAAADSDKVGIRPVRANTFPRLSRRATFESEQHKALSVELCPAALSRSLLTFK